MRLRAVSLSLLLGCEAGKEPVDTDAPPAGDDTGPEDFQAPDSGDDTGIGDTDGDTGGSPLPAPLEAELVRELHGETNQGLGNCLASGEVNGDGQLDLALHSSQIWSVGSSWRYSGRVGLALGPLLGETPGTMLERSVGYHTDCSLGDLDGDGLDDWIAGHPRDDDATGRVDLVWGAAELLGAEPDESLLGQEIGDWFGLSVSAGDLDGDGAAELMVVAYQDRTASVLRGPPRSGDETAPWVRLVTDGYILGVRPVRGSHAGLLVGTTEGVRWLPQADLDAEVDVDRLEVVLTPEAYVARALGDLDGDGLDELVAVADSQLQLVEGSDWSTPRSWWVDSSPVPPSQHSRFAVGDLDGDGGLELALGDLDGEAVNIWRWSEASGDLNALTPALTLPLPDSAGAESAFGLHLVIGDLDGDGRGELVVGAPDANEGQGAVYIYRF